jgi:hypothetical protein
LHQKRFLLGKAARELWASESNALCAPISNRVLGSLGETGFLGSASPGLSDLSDNKISLFSRRRKSFNQQYPYIVEALSDLPNGVGKLVKAGKSS